MFAGNNIDRLKGVFDSFDRDSDGFFGFSVLEDALRSIGLNPTPEELEDIRLDVRGKPISFNAFLYIVYRHARHVDVEGELIKVFRLFDRDRTGRLPADKIREVLTRCEKPFTSAQISDILSHGDVQDGLVDYENMVRAVLAV
jgi:calmodulin